MITTEQIKELRDSTGISVMQCKKALEEAGGDMKKAVMILQKKSKDAAEKKADRTLKAGVVASYVHGTGTIGAMVELACETDFVSNNPEFKAIAYDIAMHVTASNPQYLKSDDISADAKKTAEELFIKEVEGKPEAMKAKIMEGKLRAYFAERVLLEQEFIKNPELTIKNIIEGATQKFGEKIELTRFVRFAI